MPRRDCSIGGGTQHASSAASRSVIVLIGACGFCAAALAESAAIASASPAIWKRDLNIGRTYRWQTNFPAKRVSSNTTARTMNGQQVVKSFHYLLTDPPQFDILQSGPDWRGSNAVRSIETTRVHHAAWRCGRGVAAVRQRAAAAESAAHRCSPCGHSCLLLASRQ